MSSSEKSIQATPTTRVDWPRKFDLFGLQISAVEYAQAVESILDAARSKTPSIVSCHAVHALVTICGDPSLRTAANNFAMITPDGQPVRWALNWLHGLNLRERVYGPELMWRLMQECQVHDLSIYLYGGSQRTLDCLKAKVSEAFPKLTIAGAQSPPYRQLSELEMSDVAAAINATGADLVFVGLGCPKQDRFAAAQAKNILAVQVCVGAAFDFHAGAKSMAPRWMQQRGLEWLFRLACEPRRLFVRYLTTNTLFLFLLCRAKLAQVYGSGSHAAKPK